MPTRVWRHEILAVDLDQLMAQEGTHDLYSAVDPDCFPAFRPFAGCQCLVERIWHRIQRQSLVCREPRESDSTAAERLPISNRTGCRDSSGNLYRRHCWLLPGKEQQSVGLGH